MTLLKNAAIVTENGMIDSGWLLVNGGRIIALGAGVPGNVPDGTDVTDCGGRTLVPGFVEMHSHGGGGFDVMDGTPEDIIGAARAHLAHGTTTYVPTTMTCPDDELFAFFDQFREAKKVTDGMPHMPGVHLEGPYFSPAQSGAQPPEYLKKPTKEHYGEILARGGDLIVRWSIAPELDGAMALGDECRERGILAAIGHSNADFDVVKESIRHGYTLVTHLYSSMSTITRRNGFRVLGIIESAFLFDELNVELITDGKHLPPELLQLIFKTKPHDHISLITDSMRGAGMPEGESIIGSRAHGMPAIIKDGVACLPDFSGFAGSVATGDRLLRTAVKEAGVELCDAVRMLSLNPARLLRIDGEVGSIRVGKKADLVLLNNELYPYAVWVEGNRVKLK